jgi:predicted transcriptional regulator
MTTRDVTTAELAILEELWVVGRMTIKDLAQKLYGASTPSDIATVQKLLGRLEAKNCVGRDREKWPQEFFSTIAREELIGERLQATADELCEGAMGTLLTHLVQSQQLNPKERQRLRKLLDDLDSQKKK